MNAATRIGELFRRKSSLLATRDIRVGDTIRVIRAGGSMQARIEEIHRQVVALEHELGIPPRP